MPRYRILHKTVHQYETQVASSHHSAMLQPRDTPYQECVDFRLLVRPRPSNIRQRVDPFGNHITQFSLQSAHARLEVLATSLVVVRPRINPSGKPTPPWEQVAASARIPAGPEALEAAQFAYPSTHVPVLRELEAFARESAKPGRPWLETLADLNDRVHRHVAFSPGETHVGTPVEQVFIRRKGVCQDLAHLMLACLRSLGLPARYMSGYIRTRPPDGKPRLVGIDASHAWVAAFCPGHGWTEFDPTNNLLPERDHITIAHGRDYSDVSPLLGVLVGGGEHTVTVGVDVHLEPDPA
ncbi:MAG: transglutaminase family protein [Planctomycetes bacterium]|nr:transglutaminase family protein [Planctomycetota bacterium]